MVEFCAGVKRVVLVLLVLETTAWLGVIAPQLDLVAIPQVPHYVACLVQLVPIALLSPLTQLFVPLDTIVLLSP